MASFDWSQRMSKRSKRWKPSGIRGLFPLEARPGIISVLAGKPNPGTFPFNALSLELKPIEPGRPAETLRIDGDELTAGLQYAATAGLPPLIEWVRAYHGNLHGRAEDADDWTLCIGAGSGDLLSKVFLAITDPGDSILVESAAYCYAEGYLRTVEVVGPDGEAEDPLHSLRTYDVPCDGDGLIPEKLEELLEHWPKGKALPKLLCTVPTGSNPTGATAPESRRRDTLKICHRFGIPILEDDPYHSLYYGDTPRPRSFWSLEREVTGQTGLVIRSDSFSKILSSGMRLAYLSGPRQVVDTVVLYTGNNQLQPPSTTQAIVLKLLTHWGPKGLIAHCERVAAFYRERRDIIEALAKEHLADVAEWSTPQAGMFLFIKLKLPNGDAHTLIRDKAVDAGVLAAPGVAFMGPGAKSAFVRISFSIIEEAPAAEAFKRLRQVVLEAQSG